MRAVPSTSGKDGKGIKKLLKLALHLLAKRFTSYFHPIYQLFKELKII
jgi:hypothetical protein